MLTQVVNLALILLKFTAKEEHTLVYELFQDFLVKAG